MENHLPAIISGFHIMPSYHYALRNDVNDHEELGYLAMLNDEEALSFGHDVVRDILREHAASYAGSVMEITERNRAVGSIPLHSDASAASGTSLI